MAMFAAFRWNRPSSSPDFLSARYPRQSRSAGRKTAGCSHSAASADSNTQVVHESARELTVSSRPTHPRGILWVDAVGGFLMCLGDRVSIGQALPGNQVDLPILGDLSRRHATIVRSEDVYVIEPQATVCVDGKVASGPTLLTEGDEIWIGEKVRIRFRQPTALSNSARLDFLSHHRTQPMSDGVLLMGDTCLLGPERHNHICCDRWADRMILSRSGEDFRFRAQQRVEVDGIPSANTGELGWGARLAGMDFALKLERL